MKVLRDRQEGPTLRIEWAEEFTIQFPRSQLIPATQHQLSVTVGRDPIQPGAQQNIILTWFAWNLIPTSPQFKSFKNWYFMIVATANHQVSSQDPGTQAFIQTVWERIMEGVLLELKADQ